MLFGMLSRDPAGRLCLEDGEGRVVLDMEDAVCLLSLGAVPRGAIGASWTSCCDTSDPDTDAPAADANRYREKASSPRDAWC